MEIGHDKKADNSNNNAYKLNFFIRRNAVCDVVGDFLIENCNGGAGSENKYAYEEPANAKIPVHVLIIHLIFWKV